VGPGKKRMGKEEREGIKGKRKEREREDRGGIGKKGAE